MAVNWQPRESDPLDEFPSERSARAKDQSRCAPQVGEAAAPLIGTLWDDAIDAALCVIVYVMIAVYALFSVSL